MSPLISRSYNWKKMPETRLHSPKNRKVPQDCIVSNILFVKMDRMSTQNQSVNVPIDRPSSHVTAPMYTQENVPSVIWNVKRKIIMKTTSKLFMPSAAKTEMTNMEMAMMKKPLLMIALMLKMVIKGESPQAIIYATPFKTEPSLGEMPPLPPDSS